jgi:hypothetical protein
MTMLAAICMSHAPPQQPHAKYVKYVSTGGDHDLILWLIKYMNFSSSII